MANEYIRKSFAGGAVKTTLAVAINATATTLSASSGGGAAFPSTNFVIVIDRGLATEEKILVGSRTGDTFTVTQRGYDGAIAQSHSANANVEHALDAYTIDQANAIGTALTTQGDLLYKTVTGDGTAFGRIAIGTTGLPLVSNGTIPGYAQLGAAGIAAQAVDASKISTTVAGAGLSGGAGTALAVNVDNTTLEIPVDTLQLKDGGVTSAKIADLTIVNGDISATAGIVLSKLAAATAGQVIVHNATGVPTATTLSGDATVDSAGVVAIGTGVIVNADVNAAAAIAYSKLNLAGSITNADLATAAGGLGAAWTTATPTAGNLTGATIVYAARQIGKLLVFRLSATGGTVTALGAVTFAIPSVTLPVLQTVNAITGIATVVGAYVTAAGAITVYGSNAGAGFAAGAFGGCTVQGAVEIN